MPAQIAIGPIHHLRLTVTDIARSREFYTGLLGFQVAVESPAADDPTAAAAYQVLWRGVASRADLEAAARLFDERGVPHGEIKRLDGFGIDLLPFRDPDNIELELTAPVA